MQANFVISNQFWSSENVRLEYMSEKESNVQNWGAHIMMLHLYAMYNRVECI